jgi:hypothetical protein
MFTCPVNFDICYELHHPGAFIIDQDVLGDVTIVVVDILPTTMQRTV